MQNAILKGIFVIELKSGKNMIFKIFHQNFMKLI